MKVRSLILPISAAVLLLFAGDVLAKESTKSAENLNKYKISFPITQLGSCASLLECKEFCDEAANRDACLNFAKEKGFAKGLKKLNSITKSLIAKAKTNLGCSSGQECREFCAEEENRELCIEFAKNHDLKGGLKIASTGAKLKDRKNASESGEKFTPNSQRAYERANANARFCREYPEKCTNASGSAQLENKEFERKQEKEKKGEFENKKRKNGQDDSDVKGASSSLSVFQQIRNFFFK